MDGSSSYVFLYNPYAEAKTFNLTLDGSMDLVPLADGEAFAVEEIDFTSEVCGRTWEKVWHKERWKLASCYSPPFSHLAFFRDLGLAPIARLPLKGTVPPCHSISAAGRPLCSLYIRKACHPRK